MAKKYRLLDYKRLLRELKKGIKLESNIFNLKYKKGKKK